MPATKLTAPTIERMKPPTKADRLQIYDTVLPGFMVRITRNGAKTFALMTRFRGKQIKVTIGQVGVISLADARQKARDALAKVEKGEDPRAERRQARAAPSDLVEDVVADFIERHVRVNTKKRSAEETERNFRKHVLPRWSGRSIKDIKRRDVKILLNEIINEGNPIAANRVLASVRKMFNWILEDRS